MAYLPFLSKFKHSITANPSPLNSSRDYMFHLIRTINQLIKSFC